MNGEDRRLWRALGSPTEFPAFSAYKVYLFDSPEKLENGDGTWWMSDDQCDRRRLSEVGIIGIEFIGGLWP